MKKERVKIMKGKLVSLVVPEREDVVFWYKALNNPQINQYLWTWQNLYTLEFEEKYYDKLIDSNDIIQFSIMNNKLWEIIWNITLDKISHFHKTASFWMFIGEVKNHEKWYWTEALLLLLNYAFKVQWLRKISASYLSNNPRAEHVYKKVWFKEIWTKKDHFYKYWEYYDEVLIEVFKDEFYEANKDYFNKK